MEQMSAPSEPFFRTATGKRSGEIPEAGGCSFPRMEYVLPLGRRMSTPSNSAPRATSNSTAPARSEAGAGRRFSATARGHLGVFVITTRR